MRAAARRDGEFYVLDGDKSYVTNRPLADYFLVYATVAPNDGYFGLTALLLERTIHGLSTGRPFVTIGLDTAPMASLRVNGCRVPASHRVGGERQRAAVFARSMRWAAD